MPVATDVPECVPRTRKVTASLVIAPEFVDRRPLPATGSRRRPRMALASPFQGVDQRDVAVKAPFGATDAVDIVPSTVAVPCGFGSFVLALDAA